MKNKSSQQNIPNGWQEKNLGKFLVISKGKLPKKTYEVSDVDSAPYLSIKHLDGGEFKYALKSDGVIADKDDLLVIADGSGSGRMYRGYYGLVSSTFLKISSRSPSEISNDYLEVLFLHLDFTKSRFRKGGAIPHFDFKQLKDVDILLPPIKEQQRIAEILGTVDDDIAKTQEVIEATEKLKRGLMQQLFTRGIGHVKFKETKIRQIPEGWEVVSLDDISKNLDNKRIPITKSKRSAGQYPYYGATGIVDYVSDYIFEETLLLISEDGANLKDRNYPIAFTATGKYWVNNHAHIHKFEDKFLQKYAQDYLNMLNLEPYLTGMAQPKLNKDRLFTIPLPKPKEASEIKEIAEILSAVDEKISVNKKLKEKLTLLKKGLMQDLLSGKKRV